MKRIAAFGALAMAALVGVAGPGRAATIDTYSFTDEAEYVDRLSINGQPANLGAPALVPFEGQFTGTVDALGAIEQSDLTAFHVDAVYPNGTDEGFYPFAGDEAHIIFSGGLSNLSFFSFTPAGGDSTFNLIATTGYGFACTGFSAGFDPRCATPVPIGSAAAVVNYLVDGGPLTVTVYTPQFTTLKLISSVTTNPSGPAAPEPSTWTMLALGFAGIGWMGRRRFQAVLAKHPA